MLEFYLPKEKKLRGAW